MFKCILATTDGSATAQQGLDHAGQLAAALGARLILLHVIDQRPVYADFSGVADSAQMLEAQTAAAQHVLKVARDSVPVGPEAVQTRLVETASESVAEVIVREARTVGCDLVVMGTHGRTGLRHLLMGSVAESVLHHTAVPVLLVRAKG